MFQERRMATSQNLEEPVEVKVVQGKGAGGR